jgi:thioredoxin 2
MIFRCTKCGQFNTVRPDAQGRTPICGRCKQRLDLSGAPQAVSDRTFDAAIEASPIPVLVDFWAPWCGPCRMAAPAIDKLSRRRAGELLVLKVNSDENPRASQKNKIQGIPAFLVFRNGREVARQVGLLPEASLDAWVAGVVTKAS